jgi:predicted kinase
MPQAVMMIGIPGSGKSTISSFYLNTHFVISSDSIREKFFKDINDQTHNGDVFSILNDSVKFYVSNVHNIVIDATNIKKENRAKILDLIPSHYQKVAIVFINFDRAKEQNKNRSLRVVPDDVMEKMISQFEMPDDTEFDKIIYII